MRSTSAAPPCANTSSPTDVYKRQLLRRDPNERKTYVTDRMAKGVQEAVLDYDVLGTRAELSLLSLIHI